MGYFLIQTDLLDQYKDGQDVKKMEIDPKNLQFNEDGSLFYSDKNWPTFKGLYAATYNAFLNNGAYTFVEEKDDAKKAEPVVKATFEDHGNKESEIKPMIVQESQEANQIDTEMANEDVSTIFVADQEAKKRGRKSKSK